MTFDQAYKASYNYVFYRFNKFNSLQDAEDLTQETFLLLYKDFHKYDSKFKITSFIFNYIQMVNYKNRRRLAYKKRIGKTYSLEEKDGNIKNIEDIKFNYNMLNNYLDLQNILSKKEKLIVDQFFQYKNHKEVAKKLKMDVRTLNKQLKVINRKLNA